MAERGRATPGPAGLTRVTDAAGWRSRAGACPALAGTPPRAQARTRRGGAGTLGTSGCACRSATGCARSQRPPAARPGASSSLSGSRGARNCAGWLGPAPTAEPPSAALLPACAGVAPPSPRPLLRRGCALGARAGPGRAGPCGRWAVGRADAARRAAPPPPGPPLRLGGRGERRLPPAGRPRAAAGPEPAREGGGAAVRPGAALGR